MLKNEDVIYTVARLYYQDNLNQAEISNRLELSKSTVSSVGLSNICYTILHKFIQDSLRGFPAQRSHGELVIVSAVIALELP